MLSYFKKFFKSTHVPKSDTLRSELADKYSEMYGLDRVRFLMFAKLNRDAEGRKKCIEEDYIYALNTLSRMGHDNGNQAFYEYTEKHFPLTNEYKRMFQENK